MVKFKAKGWTADEEEIIEKAANKDTTIEELKKIAKTLKRSFKSVYGKYWRFKNGITRLYPKETAKEWEKTGGVKRKARKQPKKRVYEPVVKRKGKVSMKNPSIVMTKTSIQVSGFSKVTVANGVVEITL